jgi:hypothetical protein
LTKEKRRCLRLVERALKQIQLDCQLDRSEQEDRVKAGEEVSPYIDYEREFATLVSEMVIRPFGEALNQDLVELFGTLDLSEALVKELRASAFTDRRNQRKPLTPIKKAEKLTAKACQTEVTLLTKHLGKRPLTQPLQRETDVTSNSQ